jgi:serine protease Do
MKEITKNQMIYWRMLSILLLALFFFSPYSKAKDKIYTDSMSRPQVSQDETNAIYESRHNSITKAVSKCKNAIVGINVTEVRKVEERYDDFFSDPFFQQFFGREFSAPGYTREYTVRSLGSGFLISKDGYILTNHHVAGNATKIIVTMTDGKKYDAEIIGADEISDVALLKIKGLDFPFLPLSNSDDVILGEWAIAFGNPFGLFDLNAKPTVTVGVVSNVGVNFMQENRVYKNMIQTDAAVSSGNSGGPLVNSIGEVMGINTVIFSTAQSRQGVGSIGIGWAIPINRVKNIVDRIIEHKAIKRNTYTGMEIAALDARIAKYLKSDVSEGVVITTVFNASPAKKAGIEPGDIILQINNTKVNKLDDFFLEINDGVVGDTFNFVVLREKDTLNKKLTLTERK